jgi:hypothetical protein
MRRSMPAWARPEPACLPSQIFTDNLQPWPKEMFRMPVPAAPLADVLVDFVFELLLLVMLQCRLDGQPAEDWSRRV